MWCLILSLGYQKYGSKPFKKFKIPEWDKNWVLFLMLVKVSFLLIFLRLEKYCNAKLCSIVVLVSRFSGFLEPEMQVLSWLTLRLCLALPSFFFVEITLASPFASCRQTVWQVLLGSRQNSIHDALAAATSLFGLFERCMKWEGFPRCSTCMTFFSPLMRGIHGVHRKS